MKAQESVIQYRLGFTQAPPDPVDGLDELIAWRRILRPLGLVGQDPARYDGFGFGNISLRLQREAHTIGRPAFVITGSQTGHLADLGPEHFAEVIDWDTDENWVAARGPIRPSSEAMSHAAVYAASGDMGCVIHAHSPDIWRNADKLPFAATPVEAMYGTPRMAREVQRVVQSGPSRRILVMLGHEDGIIAWGVSAEAAGVTLLAALAQAYGLEA
jgi:Class II Aldolase and Adducin N-terminal domain